MFSPRRSFLAFTVVVLAGLACQVTRGGLVERYDFEGTTGLEDSSGNTNDATNSGVVFVTDPMRSSTVAEFGGGDHLGVPVGSGSTNQWSVATWMKPTVNSYFIDTRDTSGGDNLILSSGHITANNGGDNGDMGYWDGTNWINNASPNGNADLVNGLWHHTAWVFDGTANTMSYYLDGVKTNTVAATVDRNVENNFRIGQGGPDFVGRIDEFHFYDSVLTDPEVAALAVAPPLPPTPVKIQIDIDSTTGGPLDTAPGWTSLDATEPSDGDTVLVGSTLFTVFSADGSRSRGGPNALTRDFVFDDDSGAAVGLRVFNLPDGLWEASVWAWDDAVAAGDQIVGITQFAAGPEIIFTTDFAANPNDPFTFRFDSASLPDGFGIFTRENNSANRARFNALQLTRIPEPSTFVLAALGLFGLAFFARRRRTG